MIKTKACNGIGKALTAYSLIPEKKNRILHCPDDLFLAPEDPRKTPAHLYLLAPAAADVYGVSRRIMICDAERASIKAATAVIAFISRNDDLAIHRMRNPDRAGCFNLADLAAAALIKIEIDQALPHDPYIIQTRLHAVVRAPSHRDLELMRQSDIMPSIIENRMELLGKSECVDQPILACGAFA